MNFIVNKKPKTMKNSNNLGSFLKSFHHRIKDGAAHYFDSNHFMGIDPLDHSKFHDIYEDKSKPPRQKK